MYSMIPWPLNILMVGLDATTSNIANTDVTTAVIAAPAANQTYRVWAVNLTGIPSNTGKLRGLLFPHGTTLPRINLGSIVGGEDHFLLFGGLRMVQNAGLDLTHRSDVASQILRLDVYYTLEYS